MGIGENVIVDAMGHFHDLTKSAFDSFARKHGGKRAPAFFDMYKKPLYQAAADLLEGSGVDVYSIVDKDGGFSGSLGSFLEFGGKILMPAFAEAVGGPAGAALVVALEVGYEFFNETSRSDRPISGYQRGQWVLIDNGVETIQQSVDFDESFFGKPQRIPGVHEVGPNIPGNGILGEDVSVGFYIESSTALTVKVFNLQLLREQEVDIRDVTAAPNAQAVKFDDSAELSSIRELYFVEKEDRKTTLNSDVTVDPGSEVILKDDGKVYNVVTADRSQVLIEDTNGRQWEVSVSQLTPGRRTHTVSHNYVDGETAGSFYTTGETAIHSGQWVWADTSRFSQYDSTLKSDLRNELCVVHDILGADQINVFACYDGKRLEVLRKNIKIVGLGYAETLNMVQEFQVFRAAATEGMDTARLAMGNNNPLACLGLTPSGEPLIESEHTSKGAEAIYKANRSEGEVYGDRGAAKFLDNLEEMGQLIPGNNKNQVDSGIQAGINDSIESDQTAPNDGGKFALIAVGVLVVGYFVITA